MVLHRRHDRRAENREAHARQRGRQRANDRDRARRPRRTGSQLLLRAAALPRQRGDGDRARALDRRLACRMWTGERLSRPELDRQFLGAGRGVPDQCVLRRAHDLRHALAAAGRRARSVVARLCDLRRGADAGRVVQPLRGGDRHPHPGGLRAHRVGMRGLVQPDRRRAPHRLDWSGAAVAENEVRDPRRARVLRARGDDRRGRRHRAGRAQHLRGLQQRRAQCDGVDRLP